MGQCTLALALAARRLQAFDGMRPSAIAAWKESASAPASLVGAFSAPGAVSPSASLGLGLVDGDVVLSCAPVDRAAAMRALCRHPAPPGTGRSVAMVVTHPGLNRVR
jgi:hypothetical protein